MNNFGNFDLTISHSIMSRVISNSLQNRAIRFWDPNLVKLVNVRWFWGVTTKNRWWYTLYTIRSSMFLRLPVSLGASHHGWSPDFFNPLAKTHNMSFTASNPSSRTHLHCWPPPLGFTYAHYISRDMLHKYNHVLVSSHGPKTLHLLTITHHNPNHKNTYQPCILV